MAQKDAFPYQAAGATSACLAQLPAPVQYWCKNGCNFGYQGQLENRKNGFETRRGSIFRLFWLKSSRCYPAM